MNQAARVVIVGGGIAGLAAAYYLQAFAPGQALTLIEGESRMGGKIATDAQDGFVIEGGPDSFLSSKPGALDLCRELGLEDRLVGPNEAQHRTYILHGKHLYDLPEGLTGLIPSRFSPMLKTSLLSPAGKLRLFAEPVIPPAKDSREESLAGFFRRRLGGETYDRLVEPLVSGVFAGDGDRLSLDATYPSMRRLELEHGSLVRGAISMRMHLNSAPKPTARKPAFLTLPGGLAEIPAALVAHLKGIDLRLKSAIDQLEAGSDGGYHLVLRSGETLRANVVILALPAYVSAGLTASLNPRLSGALNGIPYASTATVSLGYRVEDIPRPLNGYGYVIPKIEGRPILACTWTSSKFSGRAPQGYALIRLFIGRHGQEQLLDKPDQELVNLARQELGETLGITAPPVLTRLFRWPKALAQYTLGHLSRLETIQRELGSQSGLFLAGSAYQGVGIPDCIASGKMAAKAAIAYIQSQPQGIAS
ncbi:MAG: protoporphyrinogen oxidase [Chloroflexi bacterium]|nr:protoporphyrinogen oxidase [Chloroflexota bacterium]